LWEIRWRYKELLLIEDKRVLEIWELGVKRRGYLKKDLVIIKVRINRYMVIL
jgi:hypothetical protein